MALTRISVTLLLLVGIMSVTFAAPDQNAELEKSNENADAQDVSVAAERPHRPFFLLFLFYYYYEFYSIV